MTEFNLNLLDFNNRIIEPEIQFSDLQYSRNFGGVGSLVATVSDLSYDPDMFGRDSMIRLYRTTTGGVTRLEPDAVWFVRKVELEGGNITLTCVDQMDLLRRRIVGYRANTVLADKTIDGTTDQSGPADDLMKQYVKENMGSDAVVDGTGVADTARDLSDYITVDSELSLAPTVEHAGAFQNVMDVLNSLKEKSFSAGTSLYFDLAARADGKFRFSTPILATGAARDQTQASFMFREDDGNLSRLKVTRDYSEELTFAYITSGGVDSGKRYITSSSGREGLTPFNRIEVHVNADELNDTTLADQGAGVLEGGKPKVIVDAQVVDSPLAIYGQDFYYGDRVAVIAYGYTFDCFIHSIRNRVTNRGENLTIGLTGEVPLE